MSVLILGVYVPLALIAALAVVGAGCVWAAVMCFLVYVVLRLWRLI